MNTSTNKPYRILETDKNTGKSGYMGAFGEVWEYATAQEAEEFLRRMQENHISRAFMYDRKVVKA